MSRVLTITSGKGGVGKTNLSLNLALALSKMGHRTCLFDADLGLANINILLGLHPQQDLKDVLSGGRALHEIIIRTDDGLDILPGTSGLEEIANLDAQQVDTLIRAFSDMAQYEFLLFDTSAGISRNVISFCLASSEVILVVTPEPTSMTDAFALLKVLYLNGFPGEARVVLNQCRTAEAGKQAFARFRAAVSKYLGKEILGLGMILEDEKVTEAVRLQRPLQSAFPGSPAARCIQKIADRVTANGDTSSNAMEMEGFWMRCLQSLRGPLKLPGKVKERPPEAASRPSSQDSPDGETQDRDGGHALPGPVAVASGLGPSPRSNGPEHLPPSDPGKGTGEIAPFLPIMERLVETLGSVFREIQLIREMMGGNGGGITPRDDGLRRPSVEASPKSVRLDLDSFLRRVQGGKEG